MWRKKIKNKKIKISPTDLYVFKFSVKNIYIIILQLETNDETPLKFKGQQHQINSIHDLVYVSMDQIHVIRESLSENICEVNFQIQHMVDVFIENMQTLHKSLSKNMMCCINSIHDLVYVSMDQIHVIRESLSEDICEVNFQIQHMVDAFIENMQTLHKSLLENMMCRINSIHDLMYVSMDQIHVIRESLSENICEVNFQIQHMVDGFIEHMQTLHKSLSENMMCCINSFHDLVYVSMDQIHVIRESLSENICEVNFQIQHMVDGFIENMQTLHKSLSENMMCRINSIHDLVYVSMDHLNTILENVFNMTSHLVKMYCPFMNDLANYFFIAIQMVQRIFAAAFYILSATPTILQEVFINTPTYLINNIYTGICLINDGALNAMEQCIVHFPMYVAKEIYKELPEEIQFAVNNVSSLLMAHPYFFVTICYIALYVTCL